MHQQLYISVLILQEAKEKECTVISQNIRTPITIIIRKFEKVLKLLYHTEKQRLKMKSVGLNSVILVNN